MVRPSFGFYRLDFPTEYSLAVIVTQEIEKMGSGLRFCDSSLGAHPVTGAISASPESLHALAASF